VGKKKKDRDSAEKRVGRFNQGKLTNQKRGAKRNESDHPESHAKKNDAGICQEAKRTAKLTDALSTRTNEQKHASTPGGE